MKRYKVTFIGCGNMGEAILKGITASGFIGNKSITFYEVDKKRSEYIKNTYGIDMAGSISESARNSEYILLAVKPQNIKKVLMELKKCFKQDINSVISIVAGISTDFIEKSLGGQSSVIRVMPNAPALFNSGMATISSGRYSSERDRQFTEELIKQTGKYIIIDGDLQNISTAINGSGPAYFFLFCKYIIEAAVKNGISEDIARRLVTETMIGSGIMMNGSDLEMDELISKVASPGGTTEKALQVFASRCLGDIVIEAVEDAAKRAKELEENLNE